MKLQMIQEIMYPNRPWTQGIKYSLVLFIVALQHAKWKNQMPCSSQSAKPRQKRICQRMRRMSKPLPLLPLSEESRSHEKYGSQDGISIVPLPCSMCSGRTVKQSPSKSTRWAVTSAVTPLSPGNLEFRQSQGRISRFLVNPA